MEMSFMPTVPSYNSFIAVRYLSSAAVIIIPQSLLVTANLYTNQTRHEAAFTNKLVITNLFSLKNSVFFYTE